MSSVRQLGAIITRQLENYYRLSGLMRDKPGTTDPAVAKALADAELVYGDQVPTGTYLDMTAHLPVVDPTKIAAPVCIARVKASPTGITDLTAAPAAALS